MGLDAKMSTHEHFGHVSSNHKLTLGGHSCYTKIRLIVSTISSHIHHVVYISSGKTNQKNIGVIKSSNVSAEAAQFTSNSETALCSQASVTLPTFVSGDAVFDFKELHQVVKVVTRNLNCIIDIDQYPTQESRVSNIKHRPIGIGVHGFADTLVAMQLPYDSSGARRLNIQIFETIYHAALESSLDIAVVDGPYTSWNESPGQSGYLQFDLWNVDPTTLWDWSDLKTKIYHHGIRNSLLVAVMPTTAADQILGFHRSFEPYERFS
jgi:ribonucleoside-diphosphate reductase subunit M1